VSSLNSLPSIQNPFVSSQGIIQQPWIGFLATLVSAPGPIVALKLDGSPFSYTASQNGSLSVSGGGVSAISVSRANTSVPVGTTAGLIPLSQGDTVELTYSAAPTVNFLPS
jgi:hypothetical protein